MQNEVRAEQSDTVKPGVAVQCRRSGHGPGSQTFLDSNPDFAVPSADILLILTKLQFSQQL